LNSNSVSYHKEDNIDKKQLFIAERFQRPESSIAIKEEVRMTDS
jgi:hypothetical protein